MVAPASLEVRVERLIVALGAAAQAFLETEPVDVIRFQQAVRTLVLTRGENELLWRELAAVGIPRSDPYAPVGREPLGLPEFPG